MKRYLLWLARPQGKFFFFKNPGIQSREMKRAAQAQFSDPKFAKKKLYKG